MRLQRRCGHSGSGFQIPDRKKGSQINFEKSSGSVTNFSFFKDRYPIYDPYYKLFLVDKK